MKRRKLLQNGTKVSEVGLGCMSFAGFYGATSEAEAHRTLAAALRKDMQGDGAASGPYHY